MDARLIHYSKVVDPNGAIREMVIWQLPDKNAGRAHNYKYRFYFGLADGTCLLRYDNEKRKGDHKHLGNMEEPYLFSTLDQLIRDFLAEVYKIKKEI